MSKLPHFCQTATATWGLGRIMSRVALKKLVFVHVDFCQKRNESDEQQGGNCKIVVKTLSRRKIIFAFLSYS